MSERCVEVEFGPERVRVPEGGYYDRFRMNPDLDEVARDPATGNIDFFRRIPKQQVDSGVGRVWAPNFFYRMCSVQLLYLAPAARLRAMLPQPLEPLRALPGRGLVALTFFSYLVADNDPYNEVSIAVVVRRPAARSGRSLRRPPLVAEFDPYRRVIAGLFPGARARIHDTPKVCSPAKCAKRGRWAPIFAHLIADIRRGRYMPARN